MFAKSRVSGAALFQRNLVNYNTQSDKKDPNQNEPTEKGPKSSKNYGGGGSDLVWNTQIKLHFLTASPSKINKTLS